jgi:hypothetical protein
LECGAEVVVVAGALDLDALAIQIKTVGVPFGAADADGCVNHIENGITSPQTGVQGVEIWLLRMDSRRRGT